MVSLVKRYGYLLNIMTIQEYKDELAHMSVNKIGSKKAPHKAILLLTIMDMIQSGLIDSSFIPLSVTLERRFEDMWRKYVPKDSPFQCKMSYPFFHLSSSTFWELVKLPKYESRTEYSAMSTLKRSFAGAVIGDDLFSLLKNESSWKEIQDVLIQTYLTTPKTYHSLSDKINIAAESALLYVAIICQLIA